MLAKCRTHKAIFNNALTFGGSRDERLPCPGCGESSDIGPSVKLPGVSTLTHQAAIKAFLLKHGRDKPSLALALERTEPPTAAPQ